MELPVPAYHRKSKTGRTSNQKGLYDLSRLLRLAGVSKTAYTEPCWSVGR